MHCYCTPVVYADSANYLAAFNKIYNYKTIGTVLQPFFSRLLLLNNRKHEKKGLKVLISQYRFIEQKNFSYSTSPNSFYKWRVLHNLSNISVVYTSYILCNVIWEPYMMHRYEHIALRGHWNNKTLTSRWH